MSLIATGLLFARAQEEHGKNGVAAALHPVSVKIYKKTCVLITTTYIID